MAIVCVIANLFCLLTKKDIIVHYNKFPNVGVYHPNFPNLKGHRAPSQKCKKIPAKSLDVLIDDKQSRPLCPSNLMGGSWLM